VLQNPNNLGNSLMTRDVDETARALGLEVRIFDMADPAAFAGGMAATSSDTNHTGRNVS